MHPGSTRRQQRYSRKNAPEVLRVKVEGVAIKVDGTHSKVKGIVTKETKEHNTKARSRKVIRVTKAGRGKEVKELDTKVVIKELDTKEVIRGHGPAAINGSPEMTDNNSNEGQEVAKVVVAKEEEETGRPNPHNQGTGGMITIEGQLPRTWMLTQKSAHATIEPMTKGGLGAIRHGKRRRSSQDAMTENMMSRKE